MSSSSAARRYVVLLRGINVGGHTKVAMAKLRATCESIGCTDVATYIQSGNVVLTSSLGATKLRMALEAAIADQLGVSPAVVVRKRADLTKVVAGNPFPKANTATVHVAFLTDGPDKETTSALKKLDSQPEELNVCGAEIYLHLPNGVGRAKLPVALGRLLPAGATIRNWRTVTTLRDMLSSGPGVTT